MPEYFVHVLAFLFKVLVLVYVLDEYMGLAKLIALIFLVFVLLKYIVHVVGPALVSDYGRLVSCGCVTVRCSRSTCDQRYSNS